MVNSVGNRSPADDALRMIDGVPVQAALIDADGRILAVNEHWKRFACENNYREDGYGLGTNYVDVCRAAAGEFSAEGRVVASGLRDVLSGRIGEFSLVYPCHSPMERRWFRLLASRTRDFPGAVVLHLNITPEMLAEEKAVAERVAAEKVLQTMKDNLRKSSMAEVAVIDGAAGEAAINSDQFGPLRQKYTALIEDCVAERSRGEVSGFSAHSVELAGELAAIGADASFVSKLHVDALRSASSSSREAAAFIAHEARMVFIAVLGHLANHYRGACHGDRG